jgi:thiopeptide-type bacteriocin biosynthesis protein
MITECVRPLVDGLTADGLIEGHFYINYWLEGPHVRLRLKAVSPAAVPEVRARAEAAISEFLRVRPALYEMKSEFYLNLYNTMFELEYSEDQRDELMGTDGRMRLRPINTFSWEPYEPEYGKYGGPAGIEVAEWHFQRSSELVMDVVRSMNLHVRNVLLGFAAQLMMAMTASFLRADDAMADYLETYHRFWDRTFDTVNEDGTKLVKESTYDKHYDSMTDALRERFDLIRGALADGTPHGLPSYIRSWAAHCDELRDRVRALAVEGRLEFESPTGGTARVTDPDSALRYVLVPYMHMTNNRLHVTIRDEAYLAYVLARSLRESVGTRVG